MHIRKKFWDGFDWLLRLLANAGMVLLSLMMLAVCWEVFSRYYLGRGTMWVIEFSEYSILFMTFLGTAWLLGKDGHVEMDIVVNALRPRTQRSLRVTTSILSALVCLVLTWSGTEVSLDYLQRDLHRPTPMATPYFPLFAVIPVGFFLLSIQFLRRAHHAFVAPDTAHEKERILI